MSTAIRNAMTAHPVLRPEVLTLALVICMAIVLDPGSAFPLHFGMTQTGQNPLAQTFRRSGTRATLANDGQEPTRVVDSSGTLRADNDMLLDGHQKLLTQLVVGVEEDDLSDPATVHLRTSRPCTHPARTTRLTGLSLSNCRPVGEIPRRALTSAPSSLHAAGCYASCWVHRTADIRALWHR